MCFCLPTAGSSVAACLFTTVVFFLPLRLSSRSTSFLHLFARIDQFHRITKIMSHSRYFSNDLADFDAKSSESPTKQFHQQQMKEKTLETASLCVKKFQPSSSTIDGGLYVGIAGLAYALWYASSKKHVFDEKERSKLLLAEARKLIEYNLKHESGAIKGEDGGFLVGASGIYLTGGLIYRELQDESMVKKYFEKLHKLALDSTKSLHFLKHGSDEMLVGRAGYLCAILNWNRKLQEPRFDDELIKSLVKTAIDSGREYAKKRGSPSPLMYAYHGTEYLGAAHGLSGILQMLLSFPTQLDSEQMKLVKGAVDWLCSVQFKSGNFPCSADELNSDELVHWCHGAPGTVYLLARAFQIWREDKYLQAAMACGDSVWKYGLLKKGPGVCHGIAGNAYVFLALYRLSSYRDERQLHRTLQFVKFLDSDEFKNGARTPDTPYSLFEGLAGTFCLYADLASGTDGREEWEFPLMPVFF